jgi:hypothetical protein
MRWLKRILVFMVMLACIGYYSLAEANEESVVLPVPKIAQQMGTWCWVAVSQAVLSYHGTSLEQCVLVQWAMDWNGPNNFTCCQNFQSCDFLENPPGAHGILENWGIPADLYNRALTREEIRSEIGSANPLLRFIRFKSSGAHYTVVRGYSKKLINNETQYIVHIMDPGSGDYVLLDYQDAVDNNSSSWTHSITTKSIHQNHHSGIITYNEPGVQPDQQRIYAFVRGENGHLRVNYWNGSQWIWKDQGTFIGTNVTLDPGVTTYAEYASQKFYQKIYAFVPVNNGHLHVNYFDGYNWNWADQGTPLGTKVGSKPGVISYPEGLTRKIYAFVSGIDGHLYVNYWDGSRWNWADQGTPPGTKTYSLPGVITYRENDRQRIYVFLKGLNNRLYVHYWDGNQWRWADQGTPPDSKVSHYPGVISYLEGVTRKIYVFVKGDNGNLYVNYWDGNQWRWANQSKPGISLTGYPGVITYREADKQRIYAFIAGVNGRLYVHYWDGNQWRWADQGTPAGTKIWPGHSPEVITYKTAGQQRIYAFVKGVDKRLYVNYWDGYKWNWAGQGEL